MNSMLCTVLYKVMCEVLWGSSRKLVRRMVNRQSSRGASPSVDALYLPMADGRLGLIPIELNRRRKMTYPIDLSFALCIGTHCM
eukprot:931246-Amphidinium_carterae.1